MVETTRDNLIELLLANYDDLKRRLARHFGSIDLAADALHDTFLQLHSSEIGTVQRPMAYLFRIAARLGIKERKLRRRHASLPSDEMLDKLLRDEADPVHAVETRLDIELLKRHLLQLPKRRREILTAALVHRHSQSTIAKHFDVALRTVQREIALGVAECNKQLLGEGTGANNLIKMRAELTRQRLDSSRISNSKEICPANK
jgi:RNA polymerase sigma-70 factor, ECF subfamily